MLPSAKKTLSSAMTRLERTKKIVVGLVAALAVTAGTLAVPTEAQASPLPQLTSAAPVMLMASPSDGRIAWHSSHASHASHASHYSSRY
jgi:hypothetical protein